MSMSKFDLNLDTTSLIESLWVTYIKANVILVLRREKTSWLYFDQVKFGVHSANWHHAKYNKHSKVRQNVVQSCNSKANTRWHTCVPLMHVMKHVGYACLYVNLAYVLRVPSLDEILAVLRHLHIFKVCVRIKE